MAKAQDALGALTVALVMVWLAGGVRAAAQVPTTVQTASGPVEGFYKVPSVSCL